MNRRRSDGDETWYRLLNWTKDQKAGERLSAHILKSEGFISLDPSHPLGGRDGLKDIVAMKDNQQWVAASYFPRGQKSFDTIKHKFLADRNGVVKNEANAFAFVTNQELSLGERKRLKQLGKPHTIEIFHLERLAHILDSPENYGVRLEYLDIELTKEEQLAFYASKDRRLGELAAKIECLYVDYGNFKKAFSISQNDDTFEHRSIDEIYAELERYEDQIWYNRHQVLKLKIENGGTGVAPDIWKGALRAAKQIEEKYGEENLWHESDFEWGMINGKVSTLRWVLGEEWDMLDT